MVSGYRTAGISILRYFDTMIPRYQQGEVQYPDTNRATIRYLGGGDVVRWFWRGEQTTTIVVHIDGGTVVPEGGDHPLPPIAIWSEMDMVFASTLQMLCFAFLSAVLD